METFLLDLSSEGGIFAEKNGYNEQYIGETTHGS